VCDRKGSRAPVRRGHSDIGRHAAQDWSVTAPTWHPERGRSRSGILTPLLVPCVSVVMDLDIGAYRLRLPRLATIPTPSERPAPGRSLPLARIGPFEFSAMLAEGTLQDWRDFVGWTTKYQTECWPIVVNGIPGLKLPPNDRRLDYSFQGVGDKRLDLIAWSDQETTMEQRQMVEDIIQTLSIRPRILVAP
jgi:hypothetical protein